MANSTRRYALTDYLVSFTYPSSLRTLLNGSATNTDTNNADDGITIGGQDSYLDSIEVSYENETFTTEADSTGSWVHTKNNAKNGTVSISINQVSDKVIELIRLFNIYRSNDDVLEGMTITVQNQRGTIVCTCVDCYIKKIPNQQMQSTPQLQTWELTCGKIDF